MPHVHLGAHEQIGYLESKEYRQLEGCSPGGLAVLKNDYTVLVREEVPKSLLLAGVLAV